MSLSAEEMEPSGGNAVLGGRGGGRVRWEVSQGGSGVKGVSF